MISARRRLTGSAAASGGCGFACALALFASPAALRAQSLPATLRACAAESDADRRHACYDREVARMLDAEKRSSAGQHAAPPRKAAAQQNAAARQQTVAAQQNAAAQRSEAILPPNAGAPRPAPKARSTAARRSDRLSARIVSVDSTPDELVLHLDNGEVWEQTDRTSGGLGLRAGDTVTIEKHFGSYYLSARHVSSMRVRKHSDRD
jgi:hypothetical protein